MEEVMLRKKMLFGSFHKRYKVNPIFLCCPKSYRDKNCREAQDSKACSKAS